MMPRNPKPSTIRILALDPGTRKLGYAILEEGELLYFGVHTFHSPRTAQSILSQGQRFVNALIQTYAPQFLVMEKTRYAKSKRSPLLHVFVAEIQRFVRQQGLQVGSYAPSRIKKAICAETKATRLAVAQTLVEQWYPYLDRYLRIERRTQEKYWQKMFNAVALGLTAYEEILIRLLGQQEEKR